MMRQLHTWVQEVVDGPAHLVGHSDGANVAMLSAIQRPDLVGKVLRMACTEPT
jgi:pimeloyl-ACP methyl ester carboxylesterase